MKKVISLVLALTMLLSLAACGAKAPAATEAPAATQAPAAPVATEAPAAPEAPAEGEKKVAAFVTFGLGGDFFQALADTFVANFTAAGWEASYADGEFNPTKQIEAAENYIAMDVDVLIIWSVAPEAMNTVIADAQAKGIKVIAFVAPTEAYDALMVSDEAELADDCVRLAAKWIDEHFADAEDHSVPVAVFSCRAADTGVIQADEMLKVEEFSKKAKFVKEVECADETQATGQTKMENLYTENPEIKVFLTPHNGLALGINGFFTAISSPVTDYSDMAIFAVNGDDSSCAHIQASMKGESPFRGIVLTGSVNDTANEILYVANGLMDGSLPAGHLQKAGTVFVYADTVEEYMSTGTVTSVTSENFK